MSVFSEFLMNGVFCSLFRLRSYAEECKREQREKEELLRQELAAKRARLMENGKPTPALEELLQAIFAMYATDDSGRINYTTACRLWYRCGMKLASLDSLLEVKKRKLGYVEFTDFLQLVTTVTEADIRAADYAATSSEEGRANFEVRRCRRTCSETLCVRRSHRSKPFESRETW